MDYILKYIVYYFYLSLGMNIHRFYEDCYTCDYYLSLTTCIYSMWGDIPLLSSKRPGELLTDEEDLSNHSANIFKTYNYTEVSLCGMCRVENINSHQQHDFMFHHLPVFMSFYSFYQAKRFFYYSFFSSLATAHYPLYEKLLLSYSKC